MATLIFIFFVLAGFHFIYDGIIAPNFRMQLRYKLFELRDRLIKLKIDNREELKDQVFDSLNHSINSAIHYLPHFSLFLVKVAHDEMGSSQVLRDEIEKKVALINSCKMDEVQEISQLRDFYFFTGFLINSGGWLPVLIPIAVILYLSLKVGLMASKIKKVFQKYSYAFERQVERMTDSDLTIA